MKQACSHTIIFIKEPNSMHGRRLHGVALFPPQACRVLGPLASFFGSQFPQMVSQAIILWSRHTVNSYGHSVIGHSSKVWLSLCWLQKSWLTPRHIKNFARRNRSFSLCSVEAAVFFHSCFLVPFEKLDLFILFYMWAFCLPACMCTRVCLVSTEVRRELWVPWNWS